MTKPPAGSTALNAHPRLAALTLDGYKSFAGPETLKLRPLTLLYGRNSAGKSAVLRALAILAGSVADGARTPWDLGDEHGPGRGAAFRDLPWRGHKPNRIWFRFELCWEQGTKRWKDEYTVEQRERDWPVRVRSVTPDIGSDGPSWHLVPADDPALIEYRRAHDEGVTSLRFEGLIPPSGHHQALDELSARLRSLRRGVQWLHGNRMGAPRELRLSGEGAPELLEPDGSNALVKLFMEKSELLPLVASFYAQPGIGLDLRLPNIRPDAIQPLMNHPTRADWGIALADVGEGMSKVLPVLVAAAAAVQGKGPSIVAIEDPEAHLHDDAQRLLAEHLARLVGAPSGTSEAGPADERLPRLVASPRPSVSFVLETHSRTFLLAVQNCVRKGILKPSDVQLIWADLQPDGRTSLLSIELNERGIPTNSVLRSAFSEDSALAAELAGLDG